jgi:hypothetical protein
MIDPDAYTLPHDVLLNVAKDEDARFLVTTGLAWVSGPKTRRRLLSWLIEHVEVPLDECRRMPDGLAAYVTAARS